MYCIQSNFVQNLDRVNKKQDKQKNYKMYLYKIKIISLFNSLYMLFLSRQKAVLLNCIVMLSMDCNATCSYSTAVKIFLHIHVPINVVKPKLYTTYKDICMLCSIRIIFMTTSKLIF